MKELMENGPVQGRELGGGHCPAEVGSVPWGALS